MSEAAEQNEPKTPVLCQQCSKPAIFQYADRIPLCVDCYQKVAQADFLEQQAKHNQMSWLAVQQNYLQLQL